MLEYGELTTLDNDFITIWSDFILNGPSDKFRTTLTKLAELGQINAIQSWLLIDDGKTENKKIEEYVKAIENNSVLNYNEMIVLAHKYYQNEKESINRQFRLYYEQKQYINENSFHWDSATLEDNEDELLEIKHSIRQFKSINFDRQAILDITKTPGYFSNPFLMERNAELVEGSPAGIFFGGEERAKRNSFKMLKKLFKKDQNDVRINYHLGKNLVFWQKDNSKAQALGIKILSKLASRELSIEQKNNKEKALTYN